YFVAFRRPENSIIAQIPFKNSQPSGRDRQVQPYLGLAFLPADLGLAKFALNCGYEATKVSLDKEIVGPGEHRIDRRLFANGPGYDDEWNAGLKLFDQFKSFRS